MIRDREKREREGQETERDRRQRETGDRERERREREVDGGETSPGTTHSRH